MSTFKWPHLFCQSQLDFAIVKINGAKFQEKIKGVRPIDLGVSVPIKDGDYIHVIQHPYGEQMSISVSNCKVLGTYVHCTCVEYTCLQ